ncbi:MAG: hypothetical protein NZ521_10665, partial [Flammeovirgaceae bacterium]|nr:hypothetical protein [Flammeovirgaceae bacterium]MDW8288675.1 hypothetical protein [Flammeovirgaceae bacterium]
NMYVTGSFITEGCGPWCYRREMTLVADHLWEIAEFDYVAGGQFKFVNALTWGDCTPGNPYDWGDNTPGAYSGTADQCSMNNIVFHNLPSGKYNLQFNDQTLFYRISTVSNREMYISGTFNGWAPMTMTLAGEDTWIVNVNINSGDQFKFRNTTDWSDRNYGAKEPTPTPAPYSFSGYADNLQNSLTNNNVVPPGMLSNLNKVRFNDKTYFYEIMLRVAETPTDLEITNVVPMTTIVNANHIDLSWTYNNNYYGGYKIASGVFEIFRSVDGGAFVKIGETPNITTTTYSDTSVSRGHTYSYRVRVKATALDP